MFNRLLFFYHFQILTNQPVAFRSPASCTQFAFGNCDAGTETRDTPGIKSSIWTVSYHFNNNYLNIFIAQFHCNKFCTRPRECCKKCVRDEAADRTFFNSALFEFFFFFFVRFTFNEADFLLRTNNEEG